MKYLLDTNICIAWLKGETPIKQKLTSRSPEEIATSSINLAELFSGAYNSEKKEHNLSVLHEFISEIQVINLNTDSLAEYGKLKTFLRKHGNIIDEFDLLIAAVCLASDLILVTNNEKHFARIKSLKLENWLIP